MDKNDNVNLDSLELWHRERHIFGLGHLCQGKVKRERSSHSCLPSLIFPFMEQDH